MRRIVSRFAWKGINALQAAFTVAWSAGWITAALLARIVTGSNRLPLRMARSFWAPGLLAAGFMRLEICGLDHIAPGQPSFYAVNHQSIVDIVALYRALPVPLLFVLKEELLRVPFLGWYVEAMGMITLGRHHKRKSLENLAQCRERLADGKSIVTFPEGTRSLDGRIGRFKPGTFLPAIDAQVPVIPIAMVGPGHIVPPGTFRVRPGTISLVVGRPIPTAGLGLGDRRKLADQVREAISDLHRQAVAVHKS